MSQIDELRRIIVGDNSEQIAELKDRIEDIDQRTRDVAEVLSPAIDAELEEGSQRLITSLQKPVSIGLKQAIRSEPKDYAEILYPVMAPSIRRAISQAISSMLVTINRTIESATSVRGIRLRMQSWRTGIPYAELALRQSLIYRVEHLYLIDRETGMLIEEVASQDSQSLDSDAVSAMFSAIQSFVQDSFAQDESARLTDLKVGDHNVWVAHGPKLMLACVILGDAPESLKNQLYDALYLIRTDYANPIADYRGDNSDFAGVDQLMAPLLQLQLKEDQEGGPGKTNEALLPLLLFGLIAGFFAYQWFVKSNQIATVEYYLRQAPGVAATDVYWSGDRIIVEGLQDPDARIPLGTLQSYGIDTQKIQFSMIPFRSLEVDMELQRFKQELDLPSGVYLSSNRGGNVVWLYGEAPIRWLNENDARIRQLAADRRLDISELSASFESVSDLLRANFSAADLPKIRMTSVAGDEQTLVSISGSLQSGKLALLKALFAGSHWVAVTAVPDSDSSPATSQ